MNYPPFLFIFAFPDFACIQHFHAEKKNSSGDTSKLSYWTTKY
jgi:hypothetical protein